jgi:hypothetical protein
VYNKSRFCLIISLNRESLGKKAYDAANTNDEAAVTNPDLYKTTCYNKRIILNKELSMKSII